MSAEDDVQKAIAIINESRSTHVDWRDWIAKLTPGQKVECAEEIKTAGDLNHHERCIAGYDFVISVLVGKNRTAESKIET